MKMNFKIVVGSRSYGLELSKSDTDIFSISPSAGYYDKHYSAGIDYHESSLKRFQDFLTQEKPMWYFTQVICPADTLEESDAVEFMRKTREEIANARKTAIYASLFDKGDRLRFHAEHIYNAGHPKRSTYAILMYSILSNWAEGMTFFQAHRPSGELKKFLMNVRNKELPSSLVAERIEEERKRALKAKAFFQENSTMKPVKELLVIAEKEILGGV